MDGVASAGLPPEHISDFLVTLIEDDNYFMPAFLWDCEKRELNFNRFDSVPYVIVRCRAGDNAMLFAARNSHSHHHFLFCLGK